MQARQDKINQILDKYNYPNLSLRLIASNLLELRDSSEFVYTETRNLLPLLRKVRRQLSGYKLKFFELAIQHYKKLAKNNDPWPEITENAVKDDVSILKLLKALAKKLNNEVDSAALFERQESYAWISINFPDINEILLEHKKMFSDAENVILSKALIAPVQRLSRIEMYTRTFKEQAIKANQTEMADVAGKLFQHVKRINEKLNRELVTLELHSLHHKIKGVDDESFKEKLETFYALLQSSIATKHAHGKSAKQIDNSNTMKLTRSANRMLKIILEPDYNKTTLKERYDAVRAFKKTYRATKPTNTWKTCVAVAIAAAVTVAVTALIVGISAIVGTLMGGPAGMVVGAVAGLLTGVATGVGIGVVVAAAVTGVSVGVLSGHYLFKPNKRTEAAKEVAAAAVNYVKTGHINSK